MTATALSASRRGPGPIIRDIHEKIADLALPFARTWVVMIDDFPTANWGQREI